MTNLVINDLVSGGSARCLWCNGCTNPPQWLEVMLVERNAFCDRLHESLLSCLGAGAGFMETGVFEMRPLASTARYSLLALVEYLN